MTVLLCPVKMSDLLQDHEYICIYYIPENLNLNFYI